MYARGMGDGEPIARPILGTGISIAGTFAGAALAPGALVGASLAVPIIGAAIAGVTLAITLWMNRMGPKQKVYTTKIVNEAEPLLVQNLAAWNRSNKHESEQAQALANFDRIWDAVVAACDVKELGTPGQNCIHDRQRGSNKGYDWFALYRSPIENDVVNPDPVASVAGVESLIQSGGPLPMLLLGGLVLLAVTS